MENLKKIIHFLGMKILTGLLISAGFAGGLYFVYSFQTTSTTPSTSGVGTGTADTKNESLSMPILTQSGGTYNRNTMSLQGISDAQNFGSPNNAMYNNRIILSTFPLAYDEVCFKGWVVAHDTHTAGQSTSWGNCVPGDVGYVIEQNERTATTWEAAKVTCLTVSMRLPEPMEWKMACNCATRAASYWSTCGWTTNWSEILNMVNNNEWASNAAAAMNDPNYNYTASSIMGSNFCYGGGWGVVNASYYYTVDGSFTFRCVR